jgi:hypothetical protein
VKGNWLLLSLTARCSHAKILALRNCSLIGRRESAVAVMAPAPLPQHQRSVGQLVQPFNSTIRRNEGYLTTSFAIR